MHTADIRFKKWIMLFTTIVAACTMQKTAAQTTPPVSQRHLVFYYNEFGLPNSTQPKILLISSYMYRLEEYETYKHYASSPTDQYMVMLSNAFAEKRSQIEKNEFNVNSSNYYNQIGLKGSIQKVWSYYDGFRAKGTGPELYQSVQSTNVFLANEREAIISDYRNKGYDIFQVDFDEYVEANYKGTYSRVEKLSPVYVTEYTPGCMRDIAARYQNDGGTKNKGTGEKYDPDMYCFATLAKIEKLVAAAEQSDEDADWNKASNEFNLYYAGCSNRTGLLPASIELKQKIDRHYELAALAKAFDKYTSFQFGYTGLDYKTDQDNEKQFQKIGIQFSNRSGRFVHWYFEAGYVLHSPTYEVTYKDNNNNFLRSEKNDKKGVVIGAGFGPSIGLFKDNVVLYADLGLSVFLAGKNYPDEGPGGIFLNASPGITFRLGKGFGLGFIYDYNNNLSKEKVGDIAQIYSSNGNMYTPSVTVKKPYADWSSFGVKLIFMGEKRSK